MTRLVVLLLRLGLLLSAQTPAPKATTAAAGGGGGGSSSVTQTFSRPVGICALLDNGSQGFTPFVGMPSTGNSINKGCLDNSVTGSAYVLFSESANSFYIVEFLLPSNWDGGNITAQVTISWEIADGIHPVVLKGSLGCIPIGQAWDGGPTFNTATSGSLTVGSTGRLIAPVLIGAMDHTGCVPRSLVRLKIQRDGADSYSSLAYPLHTAWSYGTTN